jgi:hypothetical protein
MVFDIQKENECKAIKKDLEEVRILATETVSRDGDEIFLLLTTSPEVFEEMAYRIKIRKQLKKRYGGGFLEFNAPRKWMYDGYKLSRDFWTSYQRNQIVCHMIQARTQLGGANKDIVKLIDDGTLKQCFPMHEQQDKENLIKDWVKRKWNSFGQPIEQIKILWRIHHIVFCMVRTLH